MKILTMLAVFLAFLITVPSLAFADETFEVTADSILFGNPGFTVRIMEPGYPTETVFGFAEAGMIRIYAVREAGLPWEVLPGSQFLCRETSMVIGNTWRFLNDDNDNETVATVVAQENVTTTAGTFSTFRVDIALASAPGTINESLWFSSGVGIVRFEEYIGGVLDWKSDLFSDNIVGGLGFFPLAVGNQWVYGDINVPVVSTSWGAIKSKYGEK